MADKDEGGAGAPRSMDALCATCGRVERHGFYDPRPPVKDACYEDYGESCLDLGYQRLLAWRKEAERLLRGMSAHAHRLAEAAFRCAPGQIGYVTAEAVYRPIDAFLGEGEGTAPEGGP